MKKISIAALAVIALTFTLLAAIPKKEIKQPPDFQTAFNAYGAALDNWVSSYRNSGDTATAYAALLSARNYIHSNWTDAQVNSNVALYWPNPIGVVAACIAHCRLDRYNCNAEPSPGPVWQLCDENYEECTSHCHY